MLPIPKTLLVHTVNYYESMTYERYEGKFGASITIKNVLVNYKKTVNKNNQAQQEKQTKGTLYIDCINSSPVFEMSYGSKIIFNNDELFVKSVKPVYAFTLHHYEVELM